MNVRRTAPLRAVVQGTYGPPDGRYAVGVTQSVDGSITFSLHPEEGVWTEDREPKSGAEVFLEDITRTTHGWRANRARFVRLGDERA